MAKSHEPGGAAPPERTAPKLLIGCEWQNASDGGTFTDVHTTRERLLGEIASATAVVDAAVCAPGCSRVVSWARRRGLAGAGCSIASPT